MIYLACVASFAIGFLVSPFCIYKLFCWADDQCPYPKIKDVQ